MARHICVWFDDGEELGCVCGDRAVLVLDENGDEVLVVLDAVRVEEIRAADVRLDERYALAVPA